MKTSILIRSEVLNKDDVQALLQTIRNCERETFPEKLITMVVNVPDLSVDECTEIMTRIKPPYDYGPFVFNKQEDKK